MRLPRSGGTRRVAWRTIAGLTIPEAVAALLPALAVYLQLAVLGANNAYLAAVSAMGDVLVALLVLVLVGRQVSEPLWRALLLAGVLLALAALWGLAGLAALPRSDWSAPFMADAGARLFSVAPDRTWLELAKLAGAGALVLAAAVGAASPRRAELAVKALLALGALHTVVGLAMYAIDPDSVAGYAKGGHQWRFTGTLLNANANATSLAMNSALAAAYFRTTLRAFMKAPSGARSDPLVRCGVAAMLIFLFAGACAMTQSRTALAALLLAVAGVVFFPSRSVNEDDDRQGARGRWLKVAVGVGASVACIGVAVALTGGSTLGRLSQIEGDLPTRLSAYRHFLGRVMEAPWFGYGLGSFAMVAGPGGDLDLAVKAWNMGAAHNAWLQAALEGGLPFALLLSLSVGVLLVLCMGRHAHRPIERAVRLGACGALFAVTLSASVDIALNVPAVAAQAMVILGVLVGVSLGGTADASRSAKRRRRSNAAHEPVEGPPDEAAPEGAT